jgi:hypothetical protein
MKQFDHMIERKLNPRLKFLAGCGQFSDFSNNEKIQKETTLEIDQIT